MIIYQARNKVNSKFYIGLTKFSLKHRRYKHFQSSNGDPKSFFHRAIRKYGVENFEWTILDSSAQTYEELKLLEIDYIAKLKPEYNMTTGGDGTAGYKISPEHRRKLSESHKGNIPWMKGKEHSKKSKMAISKAVTGKKYPNRKPMSSDQKQKLREVNLGKKAKEETKKKMRESQLKRWKIIKQSNIGD